MSHRGDDGRAVGADEMACAPDGRCRGQSWSEAANATGGLSSEPERTIRNDRNGRSPNYAPHRAAHISESPPDPRGNGLRKLREPITVGGAVPGDQRAPVCGGHRDTRVLFGTAAFQTHSFSLIVPLKNIHLKTLGLFTPINHNKEITTSAALPSVIQPGNPGHRSRTRPALTSGTYPRSPSSPSGWGDPRPPRKQRCGLQGSGRRREIRVSRTQARTPDKCRDGIAFGRK